jgi:hypothetical protein
VQQRNAERLALLEVGVDAAEDAEQLLAAMAERAADHAGAGGEPGDEVAGRGAQLDDAQVALGHACIVPRRAAALRADARP